jgi:hypothetical protein
VASWFETREDALLTMRDLRPHLEEHPQDLILGSTAKAMRLEGYSH